jgi:hypothetical protein
MLQAAREKEAEGCEVVIGIVETHGRIGTLDTDLIYQMRPIFSVDVDLFFGVMRSAPDYNVLIGFASEVQTLPRRRTIGP